MGIFTFDRLTRVSRTAGVPTLAPRFGRSSTSANKGGWGGGGEWEGGKGGGAGGERGGGGGGGSPGTEGKHFRGQLRTLSKNMTETVTH